MKEYGKIPFKQDGETESRLTYLPIGELEHHPDNPRKDLGDLSELSDSIRKNGILQNLTVVPAEDKYYVVIGNRRMEAAKLAGLTELPCIVSDMTRQEQVITMLAENMQRNDLTIYEQGWGFQLAMDLGETVESIAEKSGFSTHTIRRRAKLAELDQEKLKKVSVRQISMSELDDLNRIENVSVRNSLMDFLGTPNFKNNFKRELDAQNRKKLENRWRKVLLSAGLKEVKYHDTAFGNPKYKLSKRNYLSLSSISPSDYIRGEDEEFFAFNYGTVYLRRAATVEDHKVDAKDAMEIRKKQYAYELMKETTARMYQLRRDFVFSVTESQAGSRLYLPHIIEFIFRKEWDSRLDGGYYARYQRSKFTQKEIDAKKGFSEIEAIVNANPYQSLFRHAWVLSADSSDLGYCGSDMKHRENGRLDLIYEMLAKMGYEMSDEEKQLQDGTHELFLKDGAE